MTEIEIDAMGRLVDARVKEAISKLHVDVRTCIEGRFSKALRVSLYLGDEYLSSDYIYTEDLLNE